VGWGQDLAHAIVQVLALATAFLALSDSPATLKISLPPVTSSSSSSKGRPPGIRFLWSIKDAAAKFLPRGLPKNKVGVSL
jgi:hypothetical protein